jgi:N6-adenosine-specific RNA methylase IME4
MTPLPTVEGGFKAIVADPPWNFKVRSDKGLGRAAPYDLMDLDAIKALPVAAAAARDCHLFLWTTGPHLPQALEVIKAWGFKYSGMGFTWIKLKKGFRDDDGDFINIKTDFHVGMGYTTRKNAEFCLLGRRGSPRRLRADVREVIVSRVREHSRKPDEFYDRVRAYADGPRLELFSRESRPGYTVWGNQSTLFDGPFTIGFGEFGPCNGVKVFTSFEELLAS